LVAADAEVRDAADPRWEEGRRDNVSGQGQDDAPRVQSEMCVYVRGHARDPWSWSKGPSRSRTRLDGDRGETFGQSVCGIQRHRAPFASNARALLYLPEKWTEDGERRAKARIPEEVVFKTKIELALGMIERAAGAEIPGEIILVDSAYGLDTAEHARQWEDQCRTQPLLASPSRPRPHSLTRSLTHPPARWLYRSR
jgi:SRSO17 transposase